MPRTESRMVKLGTAAPAFELVDVVSGRAMGRDDVFALGGDDGVADAAGLVRQGLSTQEGGRSGKRGLLVMFVCVHCPFVKHMEPELARLGRDYFEGGEGPIAMVAIQSNDVAKYPEDGPEAMRAQAERLGWQFPYLLDETQEVARSFDAACTPDFFLFDAELKLVYRGQLDGSRPGSEIGVTGEDLRAALDAVVRGEQPVAEQRSSLGCNIKWREAVAV